MSSWNLCIHRLELLNMKQIRAKAKKIQQKLGNLGQSLKEVRMSISPDQTREDYCTHHRHTDRAAA